MGNVEFDLTTGGFTSTVGVTANDQDVIDEELPSDFSVVICTCIPGTFVCGMAEFTQDSEVNLCLITEDANGPTGDVRISNFDLTFVGVTVPTSEYEPVEFGTTMPETNPLTTLTYGMGEGGEVIQVTTRLVASLFVGIAPGGTQDIETSGNTFLEFSNSKVEILFNSNNSKTPSLSPLPATPLRMKLKSVVLWIASDFDSAKFSEEIINS